MMINNEVFEWICYYHFVDYIYIMNIKAVV